METAVYCPRTAAVEQVLVTPGAVVEARDLLVILK
jgi:pyruvate carboxylase